MDIETTEQPKDLLEQASRLHRIVLEQVLWVLQKKAEEGRQEFEIIIQVRPGNVEVRT